MFEEAVQKIVANYQKLPKEEIGGISAVWVFQSDLSGGYETDQENIGVLQNGSIVWAYASGCSCWDGYYETFQTKDIKTLTLKHEDTQKEWQNEIIKFAEKIK